MAFHQVIVCSALWILYGTLSGILSSLRDNRDKCLIESSWGIDPYSWLTSYGISQMIYGFCIIATAQSYQPMATFKQHIQMVPLVKFIGWVYFVYCAVWYVFGLGMVLTKRHGCFEGSIEFVVMVVDLVSILCFIVHWLSVGFPDEEYKESEIKIVVSPPEKIKTHVVCQQ